MRRLLLIGRSEAGKTTLMQRLRGEIPHYEKTQAVYAGQWIIDTPGEYCQTAQYGKALALYAYEADVVGIVISADEPYTLFSPGIASLVNREVIGIITGTDKPGAHVALCESWLRLSGCRHIFRVCSKTGEGVLALLDYLNTDAKAPEKQGKTSDSVPAPMIDDLVGSDGKRP